ncbi:MAG: L,D-transpeptidase family protein [Gammaproteobacteria bacterium]|nr:L,D-transpeptidase family protein [Gammaproteobacteria bacterium]
MMQAFSSKLGLCALLTLASASSVFADSNNSSQSDSRLPLNDQYEQLLINSLQDIQDDQLDGALEKLGTLVQTNPKFKLAQLIYGDLLMAKAGPIQDFGGTATQSDAVNGLRSEAQVRWQHHVAHPGDEQIPAYILNLDPAIKYAIVVDISHSRLYLYENQPDQPRLVSDYYVSIGRNGAIKQREGDLRTPIGVYQITESLDIAKLPDLYGSGAFPLNYPNTWDQRHGKSGSGIWLHGTQGDTFSRQPRASEGCVTMSNTDLDAIKPMLQVGRTPVIIAEEIEWVSANSVLTQRQDFDAVLNTWKSDWESRDPERYLSHYSNRFSNQDMDYKTWAQYKRRVNSQKQFINVELKGVTIFNYPGDEKLRVVTFEQDYRSDNLTNISRKQQFWRLEEDGSWRIIYEGPA